VTWSLVIAASAASEAHDDDHLERLPQWLRAFSSPDEKEGLSFTAGIIIAGSNLSVGIGYHRQNLFKNIGIELEGNVSVRRYQDYRMAIGVLGSRPTMLEFDVADRKVASLFNGSEPGMPSDAS
jgi:hypothetical protein